MVSAKKKDPLISCRAPAPPFATHRSLLHDDCSPPRVRGRGALRHRILPCESATPCHHHHFHSLHEKTVTLQAWDPHSANGGILGGRRRFLLARNLTPRGCIFFLFLFQNGCSGHGSCTANDKYVY
jgi:hypothetical protein